MSTYGTPFAETARGDTVAEPPSFGPNPSSVSPAAEAILAAQEFDHVELRRILAGMLPGERARLAVAAEILQNAILPTRRKR